jgi:hypothetical protein
VPQFARACEQVIRGCADASLQDIATSNTPEVAARTIAKAGKCAMSSSAK